MMFRSDPKSRFLVIKRTNAKHALLFVRELFRMWGQVDTLSVSHLPSNPKGNRNWNAPDAFTCFGVAIPSENSDIQGEYNQKR